MSVRSVLIVSPSDDLHAHAVSSVLKQHKVKVEWISFYNLNRNNSLTLSLKEKSEVRFVTTDNRTILLSEFSTIWWRRPKPPQSEVDLDTQTKAFVSGEWEHFIENIEAFATVRWVNPPAADRLARRKGFQLTVAQTLGLRIPKTIITNNPHEVRTLSMEGFPLIYKRIGETPRPLTATKALLQCDLDRLDILQNCPAIFQERIDACLDIRVTAIGNNLYAAEIESQSGASQLDWRFDHTVPFRKHVIDTTTTKHLQELMRKLGLVYGAIDLRLTTEGEYVFLEINPSGQYLFVELLAKLPLSKHMAEFLLL